MPTSFGGIVGVQTLEVFWRWGIGDLTDARRWVIICFVCYCSLSL